MTDTPLSPADEADVQRIVDQMVVKACGDTRRQALVDAYNLTLKPIDEVALNAASGQFRLGHQQARLEIQYTILALIDAPSEKPETGHLTQSQQLAMAHAVRKSFKIIERPENKAIDVLKAYEEWEADLVLCREAWDGGSGGLPIITESLWDRMLEIQEMRNAVLALARSP